MKKRYIFYSFILAFVLLTADIYLYISYKISLAGYYSDCVLFWACFCLMFATIFAFWKKIIAKISFVLMIFGIVLSMFPMGLPFWTILITTTGMGLDFQKKLTDKYHFRKVSYSVMTDASQGIILENQFFFLERELSHSVKRILYLKDVQFVSEDEHFIYLKTFSRDGNQIEEDSEITKIAKFY